MEDWRSAVDEKTGRTYWYHRTTRESTWTRPACLEQDSPPPPSSIRGWSSQPLSSGQIHLLELLQDLGTPDTLISLLSTKNSKEVQAEAVELLLACTLPDTIIPLAQEPHCLEGLVRVLLQKTTSLLTRRSCLRILCNMASIEKCAIFFMSSQGWTSLVTQFHKWDNDVESSMMYVLLLCLLSKGETRTLVTQNMIKKIYIWICKLSSCLDGTTSQPHVDLSVFTHHPSGKGTSLYDTNVLLQLASYGVNQYCEGVPAMLLLVMIRVAWQEPQHKEQLIVLGGLSVLQTLLLQLSEVQDTLDDNTVKALRAETEALLLDALSCSEYSRHYLLSCWVNLSRSVHHLTEAQGRDPLSVKSISPGKDNKCNPNKAQKDIELRPRDHGTAWRLSSSLLHARCPGMREMLEDFWMSIKEGGGGGLEVSVDCSESVLAAIVHYIPTGTLLPFQVSSMPELAMTLLRYQQEHIDDPDFDIDDIDETKLPLMGEDMSTSLLELCRIASELKMTELEELATRRFVQLCYDSFFAIESRGDDAYDSLEELEMAKVVFMKRALLLSEKWGLVSLQAGLSYLIHNGSCQHTDDFTPIITVPEEENSTPPPLPPPPSSSVKGERHHTPPRQEHSQEKQSSPPASMLSPGSLHRAVLNSLDDVESMLHESPDQTEVREIDSKSNAMGSTQVANKHKKSSGARSRTGRGGGRGNNRGQGQGRGMGGHGGIYRILLEEANGNGDIVEDVPEYDVCVSNEFLYVPKEKSSGVEGSEGGAKIMAMGMEIEEYMPQVHSIQPVGQNNKKSRQEKRCEEMAVPKHLRKKNKNTKTVSTKSRNLETDDILVNEDSVYDDNQSLPAAMTEAPNESVVKPDLKLLNAKKSREESNAANLEDVAPVEHYNADIRGRDDGDDSLTQQRLEPKVCNSPTISIPPDVESFTSQATLPEPPMKQQVIETRPPEPTSDCPGHVRKSLTLLKKRGSMNRLRSSNNKPPMGGVKLSEIAETDDTRTEVPNNIAEKSVGSSFNGGQLQSSFVDEVPMINPSSQLQCPNCHRKFNPEPYDKHIKICAKVFVKKRPTFDASKKRAEGIPELADAKKRARAVDKKKKKAEPVTNTTQKVPKWKAESEGLRAAMKAGRGVNNGLAMPEFVAAAPDPSLVPCPVCGRTFNKEAAERHIPQCKNIRAKPTTLKKGSGGGGGKIGNVTGGGLNKRRSTIL